MLEERIAELTQAVEALTRLVREQVDAGAPVTQPITIEPDDDPELDSEGTSAQDAEPPTREELRALCLSIVRSGVSKDEVKKAIGAVGGKMVDDVPDEKLAELEASLRALS